MEEEICLAVPASHLLSTRQSLRLNETAQESFICSHKGSGLRDITDAYCLQAGFRPRVVLESSNPGVVRDLETLDIGIAFIPKITWGSIEYGPNISMVDIEEPRCVRYIYMAWQDNRYLSSASKLFREYLIDFFSDIR